MRRKTVWSGSKGEGKDTEWLFLRFTPGIICLEKKKSKKKDILYKGRVKSTTVPSGDEEKRGTKEWENSFFVERGWSASGGTTKSR